MHGIFSLLQSLNLESRYTISSRQPEQSGHVVTNLDKYYSQTGLCYQSSSEDPSFIVTFDAPFLISGYSLSNKVGSGNNSFPRDWILYGSNSQDFSQETHLNILDKQENQLFCENQNVCSTMHTNIYSTVNVYKRYIPYRTYFFKQTKSSVNRDYLLLRAIDFYGVLCPEEGNCDFPVITFKSNSHILIPKAFFIVCFLL